MTAPLMPRATAVWLVENTTLTFRQISVFCEIHELEIQAMADGNLAKVFENQRQHQESLEKRIRADVLKSTPRPNGDSAGSTAMTLESLKKMSDREIFDFQQSHPDEYRELNVLAKRAVYITLKSLPILGI